MKIRLSQAKFILTAARDPTKTFSPLIYLAPAPAPQRLYKMDFKPIYSATREIVFISKFRRAKQTMQHLNYSTPSERKFFQIT